MNDNRPESQASQPPRRPPAAATPAQGGNRRAFALAIVIAVGVASVYISFLTQQGLDATAALYVGLPLLLAYVFIMTGKAKSATGSILKGITIALLLSAPVLQEGFICILMAAPIFYIVGAIIGAATDWARRRNSGRLQSTPAVVLLMLLSLEGTHESLTFDRDNTVRVEKLVAAPPEAIAAQLALPMQFNGDRPWFLRVFPLPAWNRNEGTAPGARRQMHFVYYKHFVTGAKIGDLVFEVSERGDNHISSTVVQDDSYLNTYLQWQSSTVSWQPVDAGHTRVTWEIAYRRKLDPAWYFAPLQQYAVTLAANLLIDTAATPPAARQADVL